MAGVAGVAACSRDEDCSLNGVCAAGACRCDSPWRGPGCGQLAFRPSAKVASLVPDSSSWGGSIVEVDGAYHSFFCRIASVFIRSCGSGGGAIVKRTASEEKTAQRRRRRDGGVA